MDLTDLNILFLGNCADPHTSEDDPNVNASKLRYHREIYEILSKLCNSVIGTNDPSSLYSEKGRYDYVFSLFNRIGFTLSEIYPSAVCESLKVAYLGAGPDVRAVAENKRFFKHIAKSCEIPVARSVSFGQGTAIERPEHLSPPYFVKPETGANSEWIRPSCYCVDWNAAEMEVDFLLSKNVNALMEEFLDGINLTVPVLGGSRPTVLGVIEVPTNEQRNILTSDEKLQECGDMSFDLFHDQIIAETVSRHAELIHKELAPIDYFRMDYRYDAKSDRLAILEINVCCDISSFGSFAFAAGQIGMSQTDLVTKILETSVARQENKIRNAQLNHI